MADLLEEEQEGVAEVAKLLLVGHLEVLERPLLSEVLAEELQVGLHT